MSESPITRRPRLKDGKSVPDRLIEAAERLIGEFGVAGVSLRQIGSAAGTVNNYAVQYHFTDLDGLIHAIFEKRMPAVNARMHERLAYLEAEGGLTDTRALVDVLLRPLLDEIDDNGAHTFARFLSALLRSADGARHFEHVVSLMQQVWYVIGLLHAANPHVPQPLLFKRLRLLAIMVLSSVFNDETTAAVDVDLVEDALGMAAAGLATVTASVI